jgi:DMSO/TMAO reductase YedYZ heme-binding membrane subunit
MPTKGTVLETLAHWRRGIRLYIAIAVLLVTLETWWWANASYGGTQLFATRMEEVFAWLGLGMICAAVSIGPMYKLWPRLWGKKIMLDARRLIGVGGAWFATLHATIAYVALFKVANPFDLPKTYQQSFALGLVGLVILLAMAGTSFDKAFTSMGVWWFRLHRLVYLALIVSLLHAFLVGTHATNPVPLIITTVVAVFILGMHAWLAFVRSARPSIWQILTIGYIGIILMLVFSYGYSQKVGYNFIEGKRNHQRT